MRKNMENIKAPQSILEEILAEMFQKLEKGDGFNTETINKLRDLADADSLIKGDNLLELLRGDVGEDPGA